MAIEYELTPVEILGYVGGIVLAVALLPQVLHTIRTKSTKDISYRWQAIYVTGLVLNYTYFVLVGVTAAWITLTVELGFALFLVVLKIRFDGFGNTRDKGGNVTDISSAATLSDTSADLEDGTQMGNIGVIRLDGNVDLDLPIEGMTYRDAMRFHHDSSISADTLVSEAYRGFHIMIDVVFDMKLPADFGRTLLAKMCEFATMHHVRVVHDHIEIFDGEVSPSGFAAVALLGESHMTAHCYSDQGKLAFDIFTCGANPDCTRRVARDVLAYVRDHLGDDAEYRIHRMPRFPL